MKYKQQETLMAALLAFCGALGIGTELSIVCQNNAAYTDILLLPCIYIFYRIYRQSFSHRQSKGFYFLTVGLSAVFSVMLVAGGAMDGYAGFGFPGDFCLRILALITAMYPVLSAITFRLDQRRSKAADIQNDKRLLKLCFGLVTLVWLLGYLALFPGVYATDVSYWYYEFSRPEVPISSQWSPLYCGMYYGFMKMGEILFDSHVAGFAIFSFLQMSFVLAVVWNVLSFLNRKFRGIVLVCSAAFFALLPTHMILSLTSAQDPVFAACFAMCVLEMLELAQDPETFWMSKKNYAKMAAWLILFCMIRNNGMYAVLVMFFLTAVFIRKCRRQIFFVTGAVIVAVLLYQGPVYHILGIQKGTALREMLSLPLQQMAYVYNYEYEQLSEQQVNQMQRYMPDEDWRMYMPCISDQIKNRMDTVAIRNDMAGFIRLYLELFLTEPVGYIKGAAMQTFGLWYPNKKWPDARIWHPYISYQCLDTYGIELAGFAVSRSSLFPAYEELLSTLYGKGEDHSGYGGNLSMEFSNVPVLGVLSKAGIYFWMTLYLFFYALYRRWREPFLILGLGIGIFVTVFLSPVIMYRYCAPMIFAAPLFAAVFFMPWKESDNYFPCRLRKWFFRKNPERRYEDEWKQGKR